MSSQNLYSPSIPTLFAQMRSTIPFKLAKRIHPIPQRVFVNLLHGNLHELQTEQVLKYRNQIHALSLVRTTWKER